MGRTVESLEKESDVNCLQLGLEFENLGIDGGQGGSREISNEAAVVIR